MGEFHEVMTQVIVGMTVSTDVSYQFETGGPPVEASKWVVRIYEITARHSCVSGRGSEGGMTSYDCRDTRP